MFTVPDEGWHKWDWPDNKPIPLAQFTRVLHIVACKACFCVKKPSPNGKVWLYQLGAGQRWSKLRSDCRVAAAADNLPS